MRGRLDAVVVLVQPPGVPAEWSRTELWATAIADGELRVVEDAGAAGARDFRAQTSGQVLVYDQAGALRFVGGITPGRGHLGDSVGRAKILELLDGGATGSVMRCATFGCALEAPPSAVQVLP